MLFALVGSFAVAYASYTYSHANNSKTQKFLSVIPTGTPTSTPLASPTPVKFTLPTQPPSSPTPNISTVYFRISNNGALITDNALTLYIKDENSGKEQRIMNESSGWTIKNLNPGRYTFAITFPTDRYFNPNKSCESCQNLQDISGFSTCGYIFDFHTGDNVKIHCDLRTTRPLNAQNTNLSNSGADTTAPNTNISYPQPNGSITYKIDGKVCAITSQPNDDQGTDGIETEYKFDDGGWSGYAGNRAYLCADSLPNGPHSLFYHSKDKIGNVEATKTINFTVNIADN